MTTLSDRPVLDTVVPATSLRNWLRLNAVFSLASGVVTMLAAGWTGDQLGTDRTGIVQLAGLALAAYGVDLVVVAGTRWTRLRRLAPAIIAADFAWVLGTILVLGFGAVGSAAGRALLAGAGVVVAALALGQLLALRDAHQTRPAIDPDDQDEDQGW